LQLQKLEKYNNMADIFFIKESYLKDYSVINDNVDFELLKPTIIKVQDIDLQQIIGTELYNDLKTKITADETLTAYPNEKNLMNNYITKVLLWYIKMELLFDLKFRLLNKGVMVKSSDNSQPADTTDLQLLKNSYRDTAESYAELLTRYLRNNEALFPKYTLVSVEGYNRKIRNYTSSVYLRDEKIKREDDNCNYNFVNGILD